MAVRTTDQEPAPGPVLALLKGAEVSALNVTLKGIFEELALEDFAACDAHELSQRIRRYDNSQRFTFGRAQSDSMPADHIREDFSAQDLLQLAMAGGPDRSYFPRDGGSDLLEPLGPLVQRCAQLVLGSGVDEALIATVFLHRTLVRPGEAYPGFFHRDLPRSTARIGTVVLYPTVHHSFIDGADLFAYNSTEPLARLRVKEPDVCFSPVDYHDAALTMGFPLNLAHGVRPGTNPTPATTDQSQLIDFIRPPLGAFVKDLAIVTFSTVSPVEE